MIIDTKWKTLSPRTSDRKRGISQADVYQMMAYGRLYDCENLMLLYPHHAGLDGPAGMAGRFHVGDDAHALTPATLDLSDPQGISDQLRGLIQALLLTCQPASAARSFSETPAPSAAVLTVVDMA